MEKSLRQRDLGWKYPFLGICDASHSWLDSLFQGELPPRWLREKVQTSPVSFQKTRISQFVFTRRLSVSLQLKVKRMSPSSQPSRAQRICWRCVCGGVFLPGVPACLYVGGARQETQWEKGLRAGIRLAHSYTAYVVHERLEVEPEIIPSWDRAGQFLLARSGGGSPFICPGGDAVDRLLGSFQFRPPCRECVGDAGEGRRRFARMWGWAHCLGGWDTCCCLEASRAAVDHHGGLRAFIGVISGSDWMRPQWQTSCMCPKCVCSDQSPVLFPSRNMAEKPSYGEWSWGGIIGPIMIQLLVGSIPTLGKVDRGRHHGKSKPKWKLVDSLGTAILTLWT